MTIIDPTTLWVADSANTLLNTFIGLGRVVGLPVSSWRDGDPTLTLAKWAARSMAARESDTAEFVKSAFLSKASGAWLTVLAAEVYGVERVLATPSTPTVTLTNGGGGFYDLRPGDLTVKCTATNVTFHSTTEGTLAAGETQTFELVSDVDGAIASVAVDEIDSLVTTLEGVTIVSSTAAAGSDEQSDPSLRTQCLATLGALSPNGPADAYEYVVRNPALTGTTEITRAKTDPNSAGGLVTVYVASASGAPGSPAVSAAQAAIDQWAEPLCITATVVAATPQAVNVTAVLTGDGIPGDFATTIGTALTALFAGLDIGDGESITLAPSKIGAVAHDTVAEVDSVAVSAPAAPLVLALGRVATLGTTSITEA